jgi:hypothetical protein
VLEAERSQYRPSTLFRLRFGTPCNELRDHNILGRVEIGQQVMELIYEAEMVAA